MRTGEYVEYGELMDRLTDGCFALLQYTRNLNLVIYKVIICKNYPENSEKVITFL